MGLRKDLQVSLPGFASAAARPATVTRQSEKLGVVGGKNRRRGEGGASENGSESGTVLASAPEKALHALKKCPQVAPRRWFLQTGGEEEQKRQAVGQAGRKGPVVGAVEAEKDLLERARMRAPM